MNGSGGPVKLLLHFLLDGFQVGAVGGVAAGSIAAGRQHREPDRGGEGPRPRRAHSVQHGQPVAGAAGGHGQDP